MENLSQIRFYIQLSLLALALWFPFLRNVVCISRGVIKCNKALVILVPKYPDEPLQIFLNTKFLFKKVLRNLCRQFAVL